MSNRLIDRYPTWMGSVVRLYSDGIELPTNVGQEVIATRDDNALVIARLTSIGYNGDIIWRVFDFFIFRPGDDHPLWVTNKLCIGEDCNIVFLDTFAIEHSRKPVPTPVTVRNDKSLDTQGVKAIPFYDEVTTWDQNANAIEQYKRHFSNQSETNSYVSDHFVSLVAFTVPVNVTELVSPQAQCYYHFRKFICEKTVLPFEGSIAYAGDVPGEIRFKVTVDNEPWDCIENCIYRSRIALLNAIDAYSNSEKITE